ncbi:DotU family type VI secretion system protein [Pseudomonas aeruginosa]|uniref:DotU family type VI secretion system protein n=23 Tax=Gammaproteobacteria TaxID=1236 RepID=UPI001EF7775A|nr:DotU family type VI secretion system protein [Pseudomonas aeruginosa]
MEAADALRRLRLPHRRPVPRAEPGLLGHSRISNDASHRRSLRHPGRRRQRKPARRPHHDHAASRRPRPGTGRRPPRRRSLHAAADGQPGAAERPRRRPQPLEQAAGPLLAMLTRLRNTIAHPAPASLRAQLLGYLRQFEEKARQAGVAPDEVMLARYVLCTALDEAVLSTPWGSTSDWGKQSLLITLHNEAWGGEKVFQLLEHCLQNPHQRLHLLELLYLCTSLGFEGRYRVMHDGRSQLEALRERTAAVIRSTRGEYEHELSPHWRGLSVMRDRLSQYLPPWVGIAIGLALLLALLFGLRMKLAADAEPVFKRIHAIGEIPVQAIDRPAVQPRVIERPRLARFLADDIKAQRVAVEDAVDRSVVTIRGDELFASASASVRDEFQPLLLRIADALRKVKGQVLVTGHSDNRPIATLRYPSNWKLSQARAQEVADLLGATTGDAGRFTAEGRSDTEPVATNASAEGRARNRRVEITVFAEGAQ